MNELLVKIKSRTSDLTKIEKRVADYISKEPEKVLYMTVNELASASGVSDASVIRFTRDMGFESFQQLKLALVKETPSSYQNGEDLIIKEDDNSKQIVDKVKLGCIKSIEDTSSITNLKLLEEAAGAILNAKRVIAFGVGSSAAVAMIIQYKFIRLGIPCVAYDDPHIQAMTVSTLKFGDVAIGVSHTGSTKDTVDSLKIAKEHGAFTVSITDHPKSPIAPHSDIMLETFSRETPIKSGAGRSIVAQIFLVEALTSMIYKLDPKHADKYGEESARAVSDKFY